MILDDDLEEFRATVRRRAESAASARSSPTWTAPSSSPPELWKELRDLELFALPFPAEVGGTGGLFLPFVVATEEVATGRRHAGALPRHDRAGRDDHPAATDQPRQVETWVPRLASGEAAAAWAFTEPQTGS